jgi:hypothetical protein
MTYRHSANGQSGGRGADIWVILTPKQAGWIARNCPGSLTVMSVDGEVVRISNFSEEVTGGQSSFVETLEVEGVS